MEQSGNEVEKISTVVDRVRELFDHHGLNANSASRELGYNGTSKLYKILQGSEPSFPTLVDMLTRWPDTSADWLLLGQGPMRRGPASPTLRDPYGAAASPTLPPTPPSSADVLRVARGGSLVDRVLTVTVDKDGEENTSLVPVVAQAGYTRHHNEAVFLQQLRHYRIPGFESGTYRAFEVNGDSMEPTLNHRDIVVGSIVEELRLLEPGEVYVVVTSESVLLKRIKDRVRASDEEITLHSDNPHRKPFGLETRDIIQLWRVRGYVSSYLPSAPDITIERLWEVIDQLGLDRGEVRRHLAEDAPADAPL